MATDSVLKTEEYLMCFVTVLRNGLVTHVNTNIEIESH